MLSVATVTQKLSGAPDLTLFAELSLISLVFLFAGAIKGMIGMGLPMVAVPLLSLFMAPAEAAAILVLPAFVTNIWQAIAGRAFFSLLRRLWLLFVGVLAGSWIAAALLNSTESPWALTVLGGVLIAYSALGLSNIHFSVEPRSENWLAPAIGVINGIVSVTTGVFSLPALPYLDGLHLSRDDLVQALGMLFALSTVALAAALAHGGILRSSVAMPSAVALAASLIGVWSGQLIRARIEPKLFRKIFLISLLLLGTHLALRSVL